MQSWLSDYPPHYFWRYRDKRTDRQWVLVDKGNIEAARAEWDRFAAEEEAEGLDNPKEKLQLSLSCRP